MGFEWNQLKENFVKEYIVDFNATQAAIRAGYSEKSAYSQGYRLLKAIQIQNAIRKEIKERNKRTEINQDYVLETILETVDRCRQVAPVLDRQGEQVYVDTKDGKIAPAFTFDAKNVLKGCELLGKHLGTWIERTKLTVEGGLNISNVDLSQLNEDELIALSKISAKIKKGDDDEN